MNQIHFKKGDKVYSTADPHVIMQVEEVKSASHIVCVWRDRRSNEKKSDVFADYELTPWEPPTNFYFSPLRM